MSMLDTAEEMKHDCDLYGAEARYEHASRVQMIAAQYAAAAADYLSQASVASSDAKRASHAAAELLKGSNDPEVFMIIAEFLERMD